MIYIESNSTSPYFNFALEEYLLTQKDLEDDEIFLFWRTNPTVMIGRYQNTYSEINEKYVKENNISVVRRNSGGGTIYTDMGTWQFTFIEKNYKKEGISFGKFIGPIVQALKNYRGNNTYIDISSKVGVHAHTWRDWENGKHAITRENFYKLKGLGILP